MDTDDVPNQQREIAEILMKLGFATAYAEDETIGMARLHWTPAGNRFRRAYRSIFDVPRIDPDDVDPRKILVLAGILLFSRDP